MTSDEWPAAGLTIAVTTGLKGVEASEWDRSAGRDNPFVSHAFLSSLEESGCVGGRTGWSPAHILVSREGAGLVAAAPCYLKTHSMGEYVFDGGWGEAYERAGGQYYPKLQVSVPFTPANGPRLLVQPGEDAATLRQILLSALEAVRDQTGCSSIHLTFLQEPDRLAAETHGYLIRTDQQFHWIDEGFGTFDGFLDALASRKRKAIRRERREALAPGIAIEWVTGSAITEAHWDAFFEFYMDTGSRKWGRPYLNRRFFSLIGERMADRILLVLAKRAGRYIAGAINLIGGEALYGRNWGAIENHPFLHFEVCYYQAIEFALARGLKRVEAGAQGEHKLARGYRPVTTYSAHHIADPGLRRAIADYLQRERLYVGHALGEYEEAVPFRKGERPIVPGSDEG
jgi:predicted N-acyltransferase